MHLCLLQNVANAASVRSSLAGGAVNATVLKARMVYEVSAFSFAFSHILFFTTDPKCGAGAAGGRGGAGGGGDQIARHAVPACRNYLLFAPVEAGPRENYVVQPTSTIP